MPLYLNMLSLVSTRQIKEQLEAYEEELRAFPNMDTYENVEVFREELTRRMR